MRVIGIAGGSGCGKTTFVARLTERLKGVGRVVLAQDAYYHDRSDFPPEERTLLNYDEPAAVDFDLLVDHVDALRRGRPVETPVYDLVASTRMPHTRRIEPAELVLVEGILVLAAEALRRLMDLRIYLDVCEEARYRRILRRDRDERARDEAAVRRRWEATVRPMHDLHVAPSRHHADLVLPWEGQREVAVDLIATWVKEGVGAPG